MPALALIVKYWWVAALVAIGLYIGALHLELQHDRATIESLRAKLENVDALGKAQAAAAAATLEKERSDASRIAAELEAERSAHAAVADDLGNRLRDYETRLGACALSKQSARAPGDRGPIASAPGASIDQRIGDTLARLIPACQAVIDHDLGTIDYIQTVRH